MLPEQQLKNQIRFLLSPCSSLTAGPAPAVSQQQPSPGSPRAASEKSMTIYSNCHVASQLHPQEDTNIQGSPSFPLPTAAHPHPKSHSCTWVKALACKKINFSFHAFGIQQAVKKKKKKKKLYILFFVKIFEHMQTKTSVRKSPPCLNK